MMSQFYRYFGAALVGYIVDFGTLILLSEVFHIHYLVAASAGFILGIIVLYLVSKRYVFGQSKLHSKTAEIGLFLIIGLVGLIILNLLMWALTGLLYVNYILSKIIATVFVYLWNFFARRSLYHS